MTAGGGPVEAAHGRGMRLAFFGLLALPFFLNDFANIYVRDARQWLAIDYVFVKALPLGILWILVRKKVFTWRELGLRRIPWKPFFAWTAALCATGLLLHRMADLFAWRLAPSPGLGSFPFIEDPRLYAFDLTAGLFGVGLTEEIVFRGAAYASLGKFFPGPRPLVFLSSIFFALIHWSLGPAALISTGIMGVFFMLAFLRLKNLWPLIVAHFFIDFVVFYRFSPSAQPI